MTGTVTIDQEEYEELLDRQFWLECLENSGVDNWDGYEFAQDLYLAANGDVEE